MNSISKMETQKGLVEIGLSKEEIRIEDLIDKSNTNFEGNKLFQ